MHVHSRKYNSMSDLKEFLGILDLSISATEFNYSVLIADLLFPFCDMAKIPEDIVLNFQSVLRQICNFHSLMVNLKV